MKCFKNKIKYIPFYDQMFELECDYNDTVIDNRYRINTNTVNKVDNVDVMTIYFDIN